MPAPAPAQSPLVSSREACAIAGTSYRQLDYWVRNGRITPAVPAEGSGSRIKFRLSQVTAIKAVAPLAEHLVWPNIDEVEAYVQAGAGAVWVLLDGTVCPSNALITQPAVWVPLWEPKEILSP
jgi:hypothetical protein